MFVLAVRVAGVAELLQVVARVAMLLEADSEPHSVQNASRGVRIAAPCAWAARYRIVVLLAMLAVILLTRASLATGAGVDAGALLPPPTNYTTSVEKLRLQAALASLNSRWYNGHPSSNWSDVGLLVHLIDFGGVPNGDNSDVTENFNLSDPLAGVWDPDPGSPAGDRMAGSIISKRHPNVFEASAFPGLVLKASDATSSRIHCVSIRDFGSYSGTDWGNNYVDVSCGELNTTRRHSPLAADCIPGCPNKGDHRYSV